jgi:hypothetical protein
MAQATATKKSTKKASQGLRGNLPRNRKAPAGGKHTGGATLGTMVLDMIRQQAEAEVRIRNDNIGKLKLLVLLESADDHGRFRTTLQTRRDEIDAAKLAASCKTMADYFKMKPSAGSEYARISEWETLSRACERGWTPDYERGWTLLVGEARTVRDNSTATVKPELVQQLQSVRADMESAKDDETREQLATLEKELVTTINTTLVPKPIATTPGAPASGAATETSMFDKCLAIFKDHPIQEVEKLAAQIVVYAAQKQNRAIKAEFDAIYADQIEKAQVQLAKPKAEQSGTSGEKTDDHAQASDSRKASKKAKK